MRLWKVEESWVSSVRQDKEILVISPLSTLYGHKARVWDAQLLPNYIISIGEVSKIISKLNSSIQDVDYRITAYRGLPQ